LPSNSLTTKVGNETALRQIESADRHRVFSVVSAAGNYFRFVEEEEIWEPDSPAVPGYWYWTESHRSGVYENIEKAENAAIGILPWLKSQISN
jgi:hypothetical protein